MAAVRKIGGRIINELLLHMRQKFVMQSLWFVVMAERLVSLNPPSLRLSTPIVNGLTIQLEWTASGPDGDPLMFVIQYSADDGQSWQVIQPNYSYFSISINSRMLPGSSAARLRVIVSDGANTAMAVSGRFSLPTHPPEILLDGLLEGQRWPFGSLLLLQGLALDAEQCAKPTLLRARPKRQNTGCGIDWPFPPVDQRRSQFAEQLHGLPANSARAVSKHSG